MRHLKPLLMLFAALLPALRAGALTDSITTSLVTCSPGTLIYEVYGHTAIRVTNHTQNTDKVYNYGLFDFNSPHFLFRWLKGETDYFVGAMPWDAFLSEYMSRGSSVYLQELNLDGAGHRRLDSLLQENCKPQNRMYRYDFLSNNCATMALDKIEEAFGVPVNYILPDTALTYRSLLHQYNGAEPWNEFGVDLITGAEADLPITFRQAAFAPMRLLQLAGTATLAGTADTTGTSVPLIRDCSEIKPPASLVFPECLITPAQAMMLLFLTTLLLCCIEWNTKKTFWIYDIVLFGIQGIMGVVIAFLYFFSSHPTTQSNWLLICLNPLPLLCLPFLIYNRRHNYFDLFLPVNFIILILFIIFHKRIPQSIHPATLILFAALALRSIGDLHMAYKNGIKGFFFKPRFKRMLTAALLVVAGSTAQAASPAGGTSHPKLVVGIVIDQLDREYVERLMPLFGNDGFKRFLDNGYYCPDTEFEYDCPDAASAIASVYTGTVPFYHGIVGGHWMDRKSQMIIGAVDDSNAGGINTIEHSSPKRLQVMSLADEMKISSDGKSVICAIASNRDAAILSGGHEADAVLWMNDIDGQWSSSAYYGRFPSWANSINNEIWSRKVWKPVLPTSLYINDSPRRLSDTFSHSFSRSDICSYKTSSLANDDVLRMALESFKAMEMGIDSNPDLLAVTFYAGGFNNEPPSVSSMELQDIYVRLDRDIADLTRLISASIGLDNVLFFMTSTGCKNREEPEIKDTRMPSGTVSMERVSALLNLYLSALYERGQYIIAYSGDNLYLDRTLIERQNIPVSKIMSDCSDFLLQVAGVKSVITQRDLISGNLSSEMIRKRNGLNYDCSGDIMIEITPGWKLVDDKSHTSRIERRSESHFPVVFYGAGIRPEVSHDRIKASAIASTVAWLLGIQPPVACVTSPLINIKH